MTVVKINLKRYGFDKIAKNYASAIKFLYSEKWLSEDTRIWDDEEEDWRPLKELCEIEEVVSLDLESFNEVFEGVFSLEEVEVYE